MEGVVATAAALWWCHCGKTAKEASGAVDFAG